MSEIVCIRFKQCGKLYDFDTGEMTLKPGDMVVVESELGLSIGKVVRKSQAPETGEQKEAKEYKKVLRMASEEDIRESRANAGIEKEAFDFCRERVMARGLQMKLIRTEATLERKRIIFYFISEKRIDFRELVKDLAQKFRTRIEMRQVGVRDEAKMTGGLGLCGRQLCCASFLSNFAPISIKMAKKQELVLNTGKLSGVCGRLMCCLSYEYGSNMSSKEEREEETADDKEVMEEAALGEMTAPEKNKSSFMAHAPGEAHSGERRDREASRGGKNKNRHFERRERRGQPQESVPGQAKTSNLESKDREKQERQGRPARPQPHGRPHQRPKQEEPGPQGAAPAANVMNAPAADSQGQAQKKKKKKRWRRRGHKGGFPGSPDAPQNPGPSGSPEA